MRHARRPSRGGARRALRPERRGGCVAWFAVHPVTDPLLSVGFGPDIGVACWVAPTGSQVLMLDHAPGQGPTNVVAVVGTIQAPPNAPRRHLWVDVARDRAVSACGGVPPWWPDDPGC